MCATVEPVRGPAYRVACAVAVADPKRPPGRVSMTWLCRGCGELQRWTDPARAPKQVGLFTR